MDVGAAVPAEESGRLARAPEDDDGDAEAVPARITKPAPHGRKKGTQWQRQPTRY